MTRTLLLCILLACPACARTDREPDERPDTVAVPVGPGTDTSVLSVPDTAGSPRETPNGR